MAYFSVLVYLFCVYIRPQEWIPSLAGIPLMNLSAIAAIVLFFLGRRKKPVSAPQNGFLIGFLAALVMSHLTHFYFAGAQSALADFSTVVIVYFLIINLADSIDKIRMMTGLIIALTVVLAVQGIIQFNTGYGLAHQPAFDQEGMPRITWIGIFNDPNDLALAFVVAVPFVLTRFMRPSIMAKAIYGSALGAIVYAIYLTNSRGGMLALISVFMLFSFRVFRNRGLLIAGIILSLAFGAVMYKCGPSRMSTISADDASAYGRIEAWYEGIQMVKAAPLFGVGYNMFVNYHYRTAHNSMVLCVAETGLVGFFLWLGLFYLSFKNTRNLSKLEGGSRSVERIRSDAFALQASLAGFLVGAFFLSRTYIVIPFILVALVVALNNVAGKYVAGMPGEKLRWPDIRNIGFASAGALLLTLVIVKAAI